MKLIQEGLTDRQAQIDSENVLSPSMCNTHTHYKWGIKYKQFVVNTFEK